MKDVDFTLRLVTGHWTPLPPLRNLLNLNFEQGEVCFYRNITIYSRNGKDPEFKKRGITSKVK